MFVDVSACVRTWLHVLHVHVLTARWAAWKHVASLFRKPETGEAYLPQQQRSNVYAGEAHSPNVFYSCGGWCCCCGSDLTSFTLRPPTEQADSVTKLKVSDWDDSEWNTSFNYLSLCFLFYPLASIFTVWTLTVGIIIVSEQMSSMVSRL